MALYKVALHPHVIKKDLLILPRKETARVMRRIGDLAADPRPRGAAKLSSREEYRLRQGNYRILYVINDKAKEVLVTNIGHRQAVYK